MVFQTTRVSQKGQPVNGNLVQYLVYIIDLQHVQTNKMTSEASNAQGTGFPQALEIMENLENHIKSSVHGKIMEFEKKLE